jgi:hypothetical protein
VSGYCRNSVPGSLVTDKARRVPRLCERDRAEPGQVARGISGRLRRGYTAGDWHVGRAGRWQTYPTTPLPNCGDD